MIDFPRHGNLDSISQLAIILAALAPAEASSTMGAMRQLSSLIGETSSLLAGPDGWVNHIAYEIYMNLSC